MNLIIHPIFKEKNSSKTFHCNIPNTTFDWIIESTAALALIAPVFLLLYYMPYLPEAVPVSFDLMGNPSTYGTKGALFVLPLASFMLYLVLSWLSWKPEIFRYPVRLTIQNVEVQYCSMYRLISRSKLILQLFLLYLTFGIISISTDSSDGLNPYILLVLLSLFILTAIYYITNTFRHKG